MRRRRDRARARGLLTWWPLLAAGGLVAVGAANRVYDLYRDGVTTYAVVVLGLAAIAAYTLRRIRHWWR